MTVVGHIQNFHDMLDIEFTIEHERLWMLQCRVGKRNGIAAVQMALDMVKEKLITKEEAVLRVTPAQLGELLLPAIDPAAEKGADEHSRLQGEKGYRCGRQRAFVGAHDK